MDSERDGYIKFTQAADYIMSRFNYLISTATIANWTKDGGKLPLTFPTTAEQLDAWFEQYLNAKRKR